MRRTRRRFFALFGFTSLVAVGSFWWQLPGLSGRHGINPAGDTIEALRRTPDLGFFDLPTLAWLSSSDQLLHLLCAACLLSSLALVVFVAPRAACLVLWACWLSLTQVCQPWLNFQWDLLLVETAFLAAFFAPRGLRPADEEPTRASTFLMRFLCCLVTFESGVVKLASGDPTWRDLTALTWHWWTQPLPAWTSHLPHALPLELQMVLCAFLFVFELPLPLLALGPRPARLIAAVGLMGLQVALFAFGNSSYYNLLTFVLAVPLLDDRALRLPGGPGVTTRSRTHLVVAVLVVLISVAAFARRTLGELPPVLARPLSVVQRFDTLNAYGAFATMTTSRPEVILEGTRDGVTWHRYELPWKPGALDRRPDFVAPFQPRLDWQLWFAALGDCRSNPWVLSLQRHLLLGTPAVLRLFEVDPFPGSPPLATRTTVHEYRFAPWSSRGQWWTATETGPYCPAVALGSEGRLRVYEGP